MKRQMYLQSVAAAALLVSIEPAIANQSSSTLGNLSLVSGDISPFSGDIDPFSGDIDPFSGDINPFRGDIDPFYGDVSPFWGDISPFWGDISPFSGDVSPFWGSVDTSSAVSGVGDYWTQVGPMWGDINTDWSALLPYTAVTASSYNSLRDDIQSLVNLSATTWGSAVTAGTSQSFEAAFADPLLAKYGIDLDDPSSLANVSAAERSQFFLEWYDGLMAHSGTDQVDHWMATVNWTPTLTQDQGEGHDAVVGLLDVRISATDDNLSSTCKMLAVTTIHRMSTARRQPA